MITVVIPVGPDPIYRQYLGDAIESVQRQTLAPTELLLIDDQAGLPWQWDGSCDDAIGGVIHRRIWRTPWLSGVAHSFNFGVALALNDLVFMMGSDDLLEPHCLQDCMDAYQANGEKPAYYHVDVKYSDGLEQSAPCNAAMVHKEMWRASGGFPVESAVGAGDTMLISILLTHKLAGQLYHVESETPPYWYRKHDQTYSRTRGSKFFAALDPVRDVVTQLWTPPHWTRRQP